MGSAGKQACGVSVWCLHRGLTHWRPGRNVTRPVVGGKYILEEVDYNLIFFVWDDKLREIFMFFRQEFCCFWTKNCIATIESHLFHFKNITEHWTSVYVWSVWLFKKRKVIVLDPIVFHYMCKNSYSKNILQNICVPQKKEPNWTELEPFWLHTTTIQYKVSIMMNVNMVTGIVKFCI